MRACVCVCACVYVRVLVSERWSHLQVFDGIVEAASDDDTEPDEGTADTDISTEKGESRCRVHQVIYHSQHVLVDYVSCVWVTGLLCRLYLFCKCIRKQTWHDLCCIILLSSIRIAMNYIYQCRINLILYNLIHDILVTAGNFISLSGYLSV